MRDYEKKVLRETWIQFIREAKKERSLIGEYRTAQSSNLSQRLLLNFNRKERKRK